MRNPEYVWSPFATIHTHRTAWHGDAYGYDCWMKVDHVEEEFTGSEYIHRDAARAWQAFRDWLDGSHDEWLEVEKAQSDTIIALRNMLENYVPRRVYESLAKRLEEAEALVLDRRAEVERLHGVLTAANKDAAHWESLASDVAALCAEAQEENEASRNALSELVAMVRGECPSLLNEDSGGSARLSMAIDDILAAEKS